MPPSRSALALGLVLGICDIAAAEAFRFRGRVTVIPAEVVDATDWALSSSTCTGGAGGAAFPASGGATVTLERRRIR